MSGPQITFGNVNLNAGAAPSPEARPLESGDAFRILVFGDFTGRENCRKNDAATIGDRPVLNVDRDNLEELMERLDVRLQRTLLTGEGEYVAIEFANFDDFHPDEIFDKLDVFSKLRQLRRQLLNPQLCDQAIAEIKSWSTTDILDLDDDDDESQPVTPASRPESVDERADTITVDELFDDVVSATETVTADPTMQWQKLVQDIVAPYGSQPVNPDRDQYVSMIDEAIQRAMRAILHHPHFASLEAIWRALQLFVRRVETNSQLTIQICDVSKSEMIEDLLRQDELDQTELHKLLVERTVGTPGGKPFTLVIASSPFDPKVDRELSALGRLHQLSALAGSCTLAGVNKGPMFWCDKEQVQSTAWLHIQSMAHAESLGVMWPDFLVRLPYGKKTSSTERFEFEEIDPSQPADDEQLLWGSAALLAGLSLAQQFANRGWQVDPTDISTHDDLPMLIRTVDGESEVRVAGKYLLTDKQIGLALASGLTPLVSKRAQNEVLFQGMQSVARTPLKGRWS